MRVVVTWRPSTVIVRGLLAAFKSLPATPPRAAGVVNAYQLAVVASLLPLAALGDVVGYKRIDRVGLAREPPRFSRGRA